ncbi:hypothetical protein J5N97_028588 [Dioscorea zingiberensis]|uniref:Uncharacterized protein n=1 Tax=Dioscorea zingiberensis TaxID=325984 RepID=A0A9D5H4Z0_9LILI|nr:hypothetical protein J5N97_028588 [Dioscorea zingiberensis]
MEMNWRSQNLLGIYRLDGSPATIFTKIKDYHPDSLTRLSDPQFIRSNEAEALRYLQDLMRIIDFTKNYGASIYELLHVWKRSIWAIGMAVRSFLITTSSSHDFVPNAPDLALRSSPKLIREYLNQCAHWIDELEYLVLRGRPSSHIVYTPRRIRCIPFIHWYATKVYHLYRKMELMKTDYLTAASFSALSLCGATSNSSSGSPSEFEASNQAFTSNPAAQETDDEVAVNIASLLEGLEI